MASSGDQSACGGPAARASKLLWSASKGRAAAPLDAPPTISAPRSSRLEAADSSSKTKEQQDVCSNGGEANLAATPEQEPAGLAFAAPAMVSPSIGVIISVVALDPVLTCLSAKDLCRLRAVCRPLHSLLSDPEFIAEHPTRQPGPLIVVGSLEESFICHVMDLFGRVVKSVRGTPDERVESIQQELVCTAIRTGPGLPTFRLRNLVTGAVHVLPQGFSEQHAASEPGISSYNQVVVLGHVASTGQYKVLRVLEAGVCQQLC
ncbi:hypothetical protein EJB05_10576, partial [Eragrostis curvula]